MRMKCTYIHWSLKHKTHGIITTVFNFVSGGRKTHNYTRAHIQLFPKHFSLIKLFLFPGQKYMLEFNENCGKLYLCVFISTFQRLPLHRYWRKQISVTANYRQHAQFWKINFWLNYMFSTINTLIWIKLIQFVVMNINLIIDGNTFFPSRNISDDTGIFWWPILKHCIFQNQFTCIYKAWIIAFVVSSIDFAWNVSQCSRCTFVILKRKTEHWFLTCVKRLSVSFLSPALFNKSKM